MTYPHIDELPDLGERESLVLDFKGELKKRKDGKFDHFYIASRVAAMANASGGTILFGARDVGDRVSKYMGFDNAAAATIESECEKAIKNRCLPPPLFRFERFDHEGKLIVAMHVEPLHSIVATSVQGDLADGHGALAWTFWVRVGSQSKDTTPEVIAMTKPETRRIANLLRYARREYDALRGQGIFQSARIFRRDTNRIAHPQVNIADVDETTNSVRFSGIANHGVLTLALDSILTVYRSDVWVVEVERL